MPSADFWVGPHSAPDTYRLISLLGGGGEGEVWRAVLPLSAQGRRQVAVKILRGSGRPDEAAQWSRVGHLLKSLTHPGLVRVTDVFIGPGMHRAGTLASSPRSAFVYVVMDYIEGVTLREWCDEHPDADAATRLGMLRTIASALDEMHSGTTTQVPVAHGDVKPSNVVVRPDGSTVLVDLGLARLTDATGMSGHTSPYAAPELRVPGALATPEADRYAFAATTAQVLTGQPPPTGPDRWLHVGDLESLLRTHPITQRRPTLVKHIVDTLIAPAEARLRQLRPWLDATADTLSQVTGPNGTPTPPFTTATWDAPADPLPPRRRRRGRVLINVSLALTVTVGGTAAAVIKIGPAAAPAISNAAPASALSAPATLAAAPTTSPPPSLAPNAGLTSDGTRPTAAVGSGAVTYLTDLTPIRGNWNHSGTLSIDGTSYAHAVNDRDCSGPSSPRTREYDLGRAYTSFQALVGMSDDTDSDAASQVELFVDDIPQGKFTIQRGTVRKIDLPVRGALTVKMIVSTLKTAHCYRGYPGLTLGDPELIS